VKPQDLASREFPVVLRGYSRDDVRAFMAVLAAEVADRDARIARLELEIARCGTERSASDDLQATDHSRAALIRQLGQETAAILEAGDVSAGRLRAEAEATAERVRADLASIGADLSDTYRLLGDLVGVVHDVADEDPSPGPPPYESLLATADVEILLPNDPEEPRFG
jgi:DivIVA domain-containing protein